jgi:hypothetical protein
MGAPLGKNPPQTAIIVQKAGSLSSASSRNTKAAAFDKLLIHKSLGLLSFTKYGKITP